MEDAAIQKIARNSGSDDDENSDLPEEISQSAAREHSRNVTLALNKAASAARMRKRSRVSKTPVANISSTPGQRRDILSTAGNEKSIIEGSDELPESILEKVAEALEVEANMKNSSEKPNRQVDRVVRKVRKCESGKCAIVQDGAAQDSVPDEHRSGAAALRFQRRAVRHSGRISVARAAATKRKQMNALAWRGR